MFRMTVCMLPMKKRPGFLLLEALLGMAIFSLFLAALGMTLLYGQENTVNAGDRTRGAYLASRTMEAVRAIRDSSFSSVTTGTKGVWIDPGTGAWSFSGTSITLSGSYTISVTVASRAADWLTWTGTTLWKHGYNRTGSILLTGEMTDWKAVRAVGNWASPTLEASLAPGGTPLFNDIAVAGNIAYVTCNATTGLYMMDITNTASPTRLNSSFSVGSSATDIAIRGKRLYILTADPNAELKVYDLTTPAEPVLVTSYNLLGSGEATALALGHTNVYVTATVSGVVGQPELYSFDISDPDSLVLESSFNDSDSLNAIALSGTSAYIAGSIDTAELRVVTAVSSGSVSSLGGYNLADRVLNGLSIAVSGTSAVLGTEKGASTQEMVMFDVGGSGVPSGSGPWYHETSGSLLDVDIDPYRCFTFVAASSGRKAFQVVDMRNKATLPELYAYDSVTGAARGLAYDLVRDRVYVTTDSAMLIFKPAATGGTCP